MTAPVRATIDSSDQTFEHLPVKDVEEAVQTEGGDIVRRQVLDDTHLVKHDNLRDEGDGLKPDGEGPSEGPRGPACVKNASSDQSHWNQHLKVRELVAERVIRRAVGHLVLHEVEDERGQRDECDFHGGVINGNEVHEEISIAHQEDDQVDLLRLG